MMMMIDVLRPIVCTWQAKWAERPPKIMRQCQRRNDLQMCPRRDSNTGGSDLCKLEYDTVRTEQLHNVPDHSDTRLYCGVPKGTRTKPKQPNISTAELYNHFLSLHGDSNDTTIDDDIRSYVDDVDGDIGNGNLDIFD